MRFASYNGTGGGNRDDVMTMINDVGRSASVERGQERDRTAAISRGDRSALQDRRRTPNAICKFLPDRRVPQSYQVLYSFV